MVDPFCFCQVIVYCHIGSELAAEGFRVHIVSIEPGKKTRMVCLKDNQAPDMPKRNIAIRAVRGREDNLRLQCLLSGIRKRGCAFLERVSLRWLLSCWTIFTSVSSNPKGFTLVPMVSLCTMAQDKDKDSDAFKRLLLVTQVKCSLQCQYRFTGLPSGHIS